MTNEMMNEEEIAIAIAIIRNEYLCVDRDCDIERNCGKCDLAMQSKEPILKAFKMAMHALETIPKYKDAYGKGWDDGAKASYEHLKMCEEEQSGDLISRQVVQTELKNCEVVDIYDENDNFVGYYNADTVDSIVRNLPSINPQEPKTGHWIIKDGKEQGYDIAGVKTWYIQIMCDKCGFIKTAIEGHIGQYKYCPSCGHHMIESQESEV